MGSTTVRSWGSAFYSVSLVLLVIALEMIVATQTERNVEMNASTSSTENMKSMTATENVCLKM